MTVSPVHSRVGSRRWFVWLAILLAVSIISGEAKAEEIELPSGSTWRRVIEQVVAGRTYELCVSLAGDRVLATSRCRVLIDGPASTSISKTLHPGDTDFYVSLRFPAAGDVVITLTTEGVAHPVHVSVHWAVIPLSEDERTTIEAEPNDHWSIANELRLGQRVHGSADDVDYLNNREEGIRGLDWFRFDVSDGPVLVFFQLDLLDRDVAANLSLFKRNEEGQPVVYERGKDPTETIHDRERVRYSKHISRVLTNGVYYLRVNANHPAYVLRTYKYSIPPYDDPESSVSTGLHYLLNVGDAWFAQIPRGGNRYVRSDTLHETATRCTACHASVFPLEAALTANESGYAIPAPAAFQYLIERLYNSATPLYGDPTIHWQRYIGIPLQSQGLGSSVLMDFERQLSGFEQPSFRRFGPFIRAAWAHRETLPDDESNAVIPLESKFELAWRAWRLLREMGRRTGDGSYEEVASKVERLLTSDRSDERVETFQDRLHRLYGWSLIRPESMHTRIQREIAGILERQNPDGGWHEEDARSGPSSVYATGQTVWTLLSAGVSRDDPRIERALRFLLGTQRSFGGWFEETNHETFRTPMRETRYALMALSKANPRPPESTSRPPAPTANTPDLSVASILDGLDYRLPRPNVPSGVALDDILGLSNHASPLVRTSAATVLGGLADEQITVTLVGLLNDPSKLVRQAAAWSLRQRGNRGLGVEAILEALRSPSARTRRGATRVFAYQFHGMDHRTELAEELIRLMDDEDLWTRLQSMRSLRQWFYRTTDVSLRLRIVEKYVARMAVENNPSIQKALCQEMYVMLDENLGGGASLQRNLKQLPASVASAALNDRKRLEQAMLDILFGALQAGTSKQRELVLYSFDGTFLDGRTFARRPPNMLDIGNDREFGFLYTPSRPKLERTFSPVLSDPMLAPDVKCMAIELAMFFGLPGINQDPAIRLSLLSSLESKSPRLQAAAQAAVADLSMAGVDRQTAEFRLLVRLLNDRGVAVAPIARLLARTPDLLKQPEIYQGIHNHLQTDSAAVSNLAPILSSPLFIDREVLSILRRFWDGDRSVGERMTVLDILDSRESILSRSGLPADAAYILDQAVTNDAFVVRERGIDLMQRVDPAHPWVVPLLQKALRDPVYVNRRRALKLIGNKSVFWARDDALEILSELLEDANAQIRRFALTIVRDSPETIKHPAISSRVVAMINDGSLGSLASELFDQHAVQYEAATHLQGVTVRQLPSFEVFRRHINPLFYEPGSDGVACAECHATHAILRIVPPTPNSSMLMSDVLINYRSALKVIDFANPHQSRLLRKPLSPNVEHPAGGGGVPNGGTLTHGGGIRWAGRESTSYGLISSWVRTSQLLDSTGTDEYIFSSRASNPEFMPELAGDGDLTTVWMTGGPDHHVEYPVSLTVDLRRFQKLRGVLYAPRQETAEGRIREFRIHLSNDGRRWLPPVAEGVWPNERSLQYIDLRDRMARFVQFRALSSYGKDDAVAIAELRFETRSPSGTESTWHVPVTFLPLDRPPTDSRQGPDAK